MKRRLTIRQRLVKSLEKRYKVVRDPKGGWYVKLDGHIRTWTSAGRDYARGCRRRSIEFRATYLLRDMRDLQRQGFKITFP